MKKILFFVTFGLLISTFSHAQFGGKLKAGLKLLKSQVTGKEVKIVEKKDYISKVELILDGKKVDGLSIADGALKATFRMHLSTEFIQAAANKTGYMFSLMIHELPSKKNLELPYQLIHEHEVDYDWSAVASTGYLDFEAEISENGILGDLLNEDGLFDKETIEIVAKLTGQDKKDWSVFQVASQANISVEMGGDKMNNIRKKDLIATFKESSPVNDEALRKRIYRYTFLKAAHKDIVNVYTVFIKNVTEKPLEGIRNIEAKVSYQTKDNQCIWVVVQVEETLSNHFSHYLPQYGGSLPCSIGEEIRNTQGWSK
jgi:hypothetical protein